MAAGPPTTADTELSAPSPTVYPAMAEKRFLPRLTENVDAVDVWFGFVPGLIRYAAFVSWADVIVRAIRGEAARENWRTRFATGALTAIGTITSGARVRGRWLRCEARPWRCGVWCAMPLRRRRCGISAQPSGITSHPNSRYACFRSPGGWSPWPA